MLTHNLHNVIIALYIIVVRFKGGFMYRSREISVISIIGVLQVVRLVED